ncbi:FxSxx-COOH system tetratricopeptide repeat protein [Wolbachia endosymbiont of Tetranychus urticae]|uniref:FxSxx-COOH system tetratricopeptide repeat protein n=1 Tax=Wolbachia endosymbiont of Tetranychus urticae TaxID=169184 RepID=UPI00397AF953
MNYSEDDNLNLPENFKIGEAIGDGDCFFDAIAKGLKQIKHDVNCDVKSLRKVCKEFVLTDRLKDEIRDKVIRDARNAYDPTVTLPTTDISDDELWNAYLASIEYAYEEIEKMRVDNPSLHQSLTDLRYGSTLKTPIWGRPDIEGKMICKKYHVKLHVIEKQPIAGWLHQIVDELGSKSVDNANYNELNTIHIINRAIGHFDPVLRIQEKQFYRHSSESDDNQITLEEELMNLLRSNLDTEDKKLEKINVLIQRGVNINFQDYNRSNDTPLHIAVRRQELKVIRLLIENKADINVKNGRGRTPLDIAMRNDKQDVVDILTQSRVKKEHVSSVLGNFAQKPFSKEQSEQPNQKQKFKNTDKKDRKKRPDPVHGNIYQLKLLMLFLYRGTSNQYSFQLGTEIEEAKKFDDLVFQYTEGGETKYRLLQAKHRLDDSDKIKSSNLLTEDDNDYSLVKYFYSYRDAKKEKLFKDGVIKDVIISTNIDLDYKDLKKNEVRVKKIESFDNILEMNDGRSSAKYEFGEELIPKLKPILEDYNLTRLARRLVECLLKKNPIKHHQQSDIFYFYHEVIANEVIDAKTKKFYDKFIRGDNISGITEKFRRTFISELRKKSKEEVNIECLNQALEDKKVGLILSKNFGKGGNSNWPNNVITDVEVKDFLSHLVFAVNQPNEEELGKIIKSEIGEDLDLVTTENTYNKFFITMLRWLQEKERGRFLSYEEGKEFFEEAKRGLPILFNVRDPVSSFTGRIEQLDNLHKAMMNGGRAIVSQSVSISGLGGVGKSELARKYIREYSRDYDNKVIWINAENHNTLSESFRRLACDKLGISLKNRDGKEKDIKSIVEDVYRFFSKGKSLFIFDNAEKYRSQREDDDGIDKFLPSLPENMNKPHILVTSRNTKWPKHVKICSLNTFTKAESIEFIKKALRMENSKQDEDIIKLAETLQYFPLALQQVVAYIREKKKELRNVGLEFTINDYLQRYEGKTRELLNFPFPEDSDDNYTKATFTALKVQLDAVEKRENGNKAIEIINVIAYLAPENISTKMFLSLRSNKEELGSAIGLLKQYSIVNVEQEQVVLSVHRLVQQVTRLYLDEQGKAEETIDQAFNLLKGNFPYCSDRSEDSAKKRELLPHCEALLSYLDNWLMKKTEDKQKVEDYVEQLIELMRDGYYDLGNYKRQKELLEKALPIFEKRYSSNHVEVAKTLGNLSNTYGDLGDPNKQKELLERTLDIQERCYGSDHVEVARTLVNLGNAYGDLGDYSKAKELLERALDIKERDYGNDHVEVAGTLTNLGATYRDLGNPNKAKELLERALDIKERDYGNDHIEIARTLVNLGNACGDSGDHHEKKELLERALGILEKHYGSDHVEVAKTLVNLGNACGDLGDHHKKKELLERALGILEKHYGRDHFEVAKTLGNLGSAYGSLGDHHEKKELLERALGILEKHYGTDHVIVAIILLNLGNAYGSLGDHHEKKELLERALGILEKHYGTDHVIVAIILLNLGNAYGSLGDHHEKKELLERALPILEKNNHPVVSQVKAILNTLSNHDKSLVPLLQAVQSGNLEEVKSLVQNGSDINAQDANGTMPLCHAAYSGHVNIVDFLLEKGADITKTSNNGNTPLHIASNKGNTKAVKILLAHVKNKYSDKLGQFINTQTTAGETSALHIASNIEVTRSLLQYGAVYNIKNKEGKTPLDLAKNDDIRKLLSFTNELFEGVKKGNLQIISKLRSLKADDFIAVTNARNDQGHTLLQVAIANKHRDIATELSKMLKNLAPSSSMESVNVASPSRSYGNLPL